MKSSLNLMAALLLFLLHTVAAQDSGDCQVIRDWIAGVSGTNVSLPSSGSCCDSGDIDCNSAGRITNLKVYINMTTYNPFLSIIYSTILFILVFLYSLARKD